MDTPPIRSSTRWLRALLVWLLLTAATSALRSSSAAAQNPTTPPTYHVDGASTGGRCSDSHTPSQAESPSTPWCTISAAVAQAPPGSVIRVAPGTYRETVTLTPRDDGVTLMGVGTSRPVIEGDWTRSAGIQLVNGVHDVTITGFEVRDLVASSQGRAVGFLSLDTHNDRIENNVVHAVHGSGLWSYGIMLGTNADPGLVHSVTVSGNRIYDIGPGGESMGIWLLMTTNMLIRDNEIYLVRKEGIRDWYGLANSFIGNRLYLNWTGIALESAVGDYVADNVAYANVWGYDPKHVSEASALTMWGLRTGLWSRFWHNTSYGNTHADIALGMDPPNEDYIDVRDNVFATPGDVHLHDFPSIRGSHIILDGNAYSGSAPFYYTDWNVPHRVEYKTLATLRSALGWEVHGQVGAPQFRDPTDGDFSFDVSGMRPGVSLPDALGAQLGAANVAPASNSWTRYPTRVIASTPVAPYSDLSAAGDGRDDSYWWSSNYNTNASVTFDLRAPKQMNTFVLDMFGHLDPRNPRGYSIQVSNGNRNYWTVSAGVNPDSEGSSYKYTLSSPVTARYVRLNLLTSFGGSTLIFSDFGIGLLAPTGSATSRPAARSANHQSSRHEHRRRDRRAHHRTHSFRRTAKHWSHHRRRAP
jgi:F5/8 type C domain/Right handed beta helix region